MSSSRAPSREGARLEDIGYPIAEIERDGTFVITKHHGTGGWVDARTVKEQLVYEIGDPTRYIGPDCVSDFTAITVTDEGHDRVRVTGARGTAPTEFLKASINYSAGWKAVGTIVFTSPRALEKAQEADRIVRSRLNQLGLQFDEVYTEVFGVNACHGAAAPRVAGCLRRGSSRSA